MQAGFNWSESSTSKPSPWRKLVSLANDFFHGDKIAVTVLGNLEGMKLTRGQLAC
jgi:hypothetical protein